LGSLVGYYWLTTWGEWGSVSDDFLLKPSLPLVGRLCRSCRGSPRAFLALELLFKLALDTLDTLFFCLAGSSH